MGGREGWVVSGPKRRARVVCGLAVAAGMAGGCAHAADAGSINVAELSGVQVTAAKRALDTPAGAAVLPTTIQDLPQAATVIDAAQLKAQGVSSLEQALRNVPGITVAIGEGGTLNGDQFKIRGFDSKDDVYVDGLRDFGVYTRDSFNYQEVQVLKGPSGAMFGRGTTGGVINTVSKQARLQDAASVDLYAGNGDYYRALADVNHRLGETSAVRLNLMASSTGVVDRDLVTSDRWGAAVSAGFGLGTDTQLLLDYVHQADRRRPDYGVIIVQRPGEIVARPATQYGVGVERSSYLGFRNDLDRTKADILTARLSHRVSEHLTLTSDTRYGGYSRYFQYSTLDQCAAACTTALFDGLAATEAFGGIGGSSPYDLDAWGLQNITTARFDYRLGGLRSQTLVGIDLSRQENDRLFYAYSLPAPYATRPALPHPIVNPDPNFPAGYDVFRAVPGRNINCSGAGNCTTTVNGQTVFTNVTGAGTLESKGRADDAGVLLIQRLWFNEALSVIAGLRLDRYSARFSTVTYAGTEAPAGGLRVNSTLRSPRVSLVYEPAADQTFYLSWGRSQTPQGTSIVGSGTALTVTAKDLAPEKSEVLEAGAKVGVPGTRLSATASLFRVKKNNALQTDASTGFLLAQSGERQAVKGLELGLSGKLTPAWTINATYSLLDSKVQESFSNCTVPTSTTGTPTNIVCPVGVTAAIPILNTAAVGRQVANVPRHAASVFTSYDLAGVVDGLTVGGDASYQSKLYVTYTARSVSYADRASLTPLRTGEIPASFTLNAFASLDRGPYRFAVNVYNLTNRMNYVQVFTNRAVPAAGRTVIVSVGAGF